MNALASRRTILGSLAALPMLQVPTVASPEADAAFLALAPQILPMLDRYDELWSVTGPLWEIGIEEVLHLHQDGMNRDEAEAASGAWRRYEDAYKPANEVLNAIEEIVLPFMDKPVSTLSGLLFKARIGASLDHFADDAASDLLKMVEAGALRV